MSNAHVARKVAGSNAHLEFFRSTTARGVGFALAVYIASRVLTFFSLYIGTRLWPDKTTKLGLLQWDSLWYVEIIENGYPHVATNGVTGYEAQNAIAFFPVYPLVCRVLQVFTPATAFQTALTVSLISGATACVLLWFLAKKLTDESTANRAVALFAFFPGSIAATMLMAEGLMITCVIGCMLAMLHKRWILAGVLAAIATGTRPNGFILGFACAFVAAEAIYKRREWRALIAPLLSPLGVLGYFLFLWHHTGDFLAWKHVEDAGWEYDKLGLFLPLQSLRYPVMHLDSLMCVIALAITAVGTYAMVRWRPPAMLSIYTLGIIVLAFSTGLTPSKLRYVWSAFPVIIALARIKQEVIFTILLAASSVTLTLYVVVALSAGLAIP